MFKGVYARNRLPRLLNVPCGKYGSRPSNGTTLGRYIHRRQLKRGILRPYWNTTLFKSLRELYEQTLYELNLYTVRVQEEGYTVCGHHWIFYLIHRCAGHSMIDVTRLLISLRLGFRRNVLSVLHPNLVSSSIKGILERTGSYKSKIDPTSDVDKIFSKMYSQYVLFINKYS